MSKEFKLTKKEKIISLIFLMSKSKTNLRTDSFLLDCIVDSKSVSFSETNPNKNNILFERFLNDLCELNLIVQTEIASVTNEKENIKKIGQSNQYMDCCNLWYYSRIEEASNSSFKKYKFTFKFKDFIYNKFNISIFEDDEVAYFLIKEILINEYPEISNLQYNYLEDSKVILKTLIFEQ